MKMNSFYCEKAEKNFQTWPWSYFWTAMDLFLEQKMKKFAKWERLFLLIFFLKISGDFYKKRPLCMETPCLKFMDPKKKSLSFNWKGSLTNWVVFYLIKKSCCQ